MKDKILCIVGRSGSGKTTIAEKLEKEALLLYSHTQPGSLGLRAKEDILL